MTDDVLRIAVTMRIVQASGYMEERDALAHHWTSFLHSALPDVLWLPLPNLGAERIVPYCERWGINRLILTGGDDLDETPRRDETEMRLLDWASAARFPVVGVCRGMQMMARWAGTGLKAVPDHAGTRHRVHGARKGMVNSFHRFSIADCPPGFEIMSQSPDGEIEAIRHTDLRWEGWMWHPERESVFHAEDIDRLKRLFA